MEFHAYSFIENLKYMGLGMLGIFIVIGVIIGATYLLNRLFRPKLSSKPEQDNE